MSVLEGLSKIMQEAQENMVSVEFQRASMKLSDSKGEVREEIQNITAQEMKVILKKLESEKSLTSEELECVRLWIVGDAAYYIEMENNFEDWLKEFSRLKEVLVGYEAQVLSIEALSQAHGILEDATRISADISNFLEKKERVVQFTKATKDLDVLDREALRDILKLKLLSPNM